MAKRVRQNTAVRPDEVITEAPAHRKADHRVRAALANYTGADWPVTEFALVNSHDGEYELGNAAAARPNTCCASDHTPRERSR